MAKCSSCASTQSQHSSASTGLLAHFQNQILSTEPERSLVLWTSCPGMDTRLSTGELTG